MEKITVEKNQALYEILLRFDPDGNLQGAHTARQEVLRDEAGAVVKHTALPPQPVSVDDLNGIFDNAQIAALITQVQMLKMQLQVSAKRQLELVEMGKQLIEINQQAIAEQAKREKTESAHNGS